MILSDNETKVDLLNNEAIAKTIVSLIRDSKDQPISIGIHGDWGAGKSSILEMVENEVNGSNSDRYLTTSREKSIHAYVSMDGGIKDLKIQKSP